MDGKIFINYRRENAGAAAGRLYDRLALTFGRDALFMDVDHIPAGADFVRFLSDQVARSDVFLVIIGRGWAETQDAAGRRRIHNPDDFVAIEISAALARGKLVIPVLVDGALMPSAGELPSSLQLLSWRNAVEVRNAQFGRDVEVLIDKIRSLTAGMRLHPTSEARRRSAMRWSYRRFATVVFRLSVVAAALSAGAQVFQTYRGHVAAVNDQAAYRFEVDMAMSCALRLDQKVWSAAENNFQNVDLQKLHCANRALFTNAKEISQFRENKEGYLDSLSKYIPPLFIAELMALWALAAFLVVNAVGWTLIGAATIAQWVVGTRRAG